MTQDVTDKNFEAEVLKSDIPVMIDFWAEWCGPCRAMAPIVDKIADAKKGTLKVVKMNIEENPDTPTKYGIRGIPTFMVFKNGQLVDTKVGGMSQDQMANWVEKI
ncbi:MAG: thioredoxin [Alphaproteobacteria bacterium]|nr:thioredoxin [Alphaproteobacteria bacterium]